MTQGPYDRQPPPLPTDDDLSILEDDEPEARPPTSSGLATATLVVGLLALMFPPLGIAAVIMGIIALNQISASRGRLTGQGQALAGTITGGVGLVLGLCMIGILLPALGAARRTARQMMNSSQQRGVHQGMYTFAQSNRASGQDGFFPGLTAKGAMLIKDVDGTYSTSGIVGDHPAYRLALLLNSGFFAPEYLINPMDRDAGRVLANPNTPVDESNYSYALLKIESGQIGQIGQGGEDEFRAMEWRDTSNSAAPVIADRNRGSDAEANAHSVWTAPGKGWEGTVTNNDGSTNFVSILGDGTIAASSVRTRVPIVSNTRYGRGARNFEDNLFIADDGDPQSPNANAAMVFQDGATLVNQD